MASSMQTFDKAVAGINKGSDKKHEMRIMMAPYANWDQFLAPAPMSIALLGHLILVSADCDFSLRNDKNKDAQFKLLNYPDSFRACLVQVTNQGWGAFDKAHTNMDQIRLLSGNVDGHVRQAVTFLLKGTPQEIELMLPNALKSIENVADRCLTLASSVEEEFVKVMAVVGELLEACTQAKGQYEEELKKTKIAIDIAMENKRALEKENAEAETNRKEMMKQMDDAEKEYKEAMKNVPGAGDLMGLALADCFINVVKKISNIIPGGGDNSPAGKSPKYRPKSQRSGGTHPLKNIILVVDKIRVQANLVWDWRQETSEVGESNRTGMKLATGRRQSNKSFKVWQKICQKPYQISKNQYINSLGKASRFAKACFTCRAPCAETKWT